MIPVLFADAEVDQMTVASAFVMGRNMFGPVRGEWDRQWKGWWGDDPPFHTVVVGARDSTPTTHFSCVMLGHMDSTFGQFRETACPGAYPQASRVVDR